jgi:hypothetical protein
MADLGEVRAKMTAMFTPDALSKMGAKELVRKLAEGMGLERDALMGQREEIGAVAVEIIKQGRGEDFCSSGRETLRNAPTEMPHQ